MQIVRKASSWNVVLRFLNSLQGMDLISRYVIMQGRSLEGQWREAYDAASCLAEKKGFKSKLDDLVFRTPDAWRTILTERVIISLGLVLGAAIALAVRDQLSLRHFHKLYSPFEIRIPLHSLKKHPAGGKIQ